jgi:hypothetical protein
MKLNVRGRHYSGTELQDSKGRKRAEEARAKVGQGDQESAGKSEVQDRISQKERTRSGILWLDLGRQ